MTEREPPGALPHEKDGGFEDSFLARNNIHPVVFAFVCLFLVFVLYQVIGGTLTFLLIGQTEITAENVTAVRLLTLLGQILFILLPTFLFARMMAARTASVFRWRMPSPPEAFFAAISVVFLQQVLQIYLYFQERVPIPDSIREILEPFRESLEEMFRSIVSAETVPELLVVMVIVAVAPSVIEEMFFRGVVQHAFDRVAPGMLSAAIVGLIFALYHFNPFAFVPLVVLGCYFGFLRHRSQSIIVPMMAHFINNALAVLTVYLGMENEALVGSASEGQATLVAVLSQLFLLAGLFGLSVFAYFRFSARAATEPGTRAGAGA